MDFYILIKLLLFLQISEIGFSNKISSSKATPGINGWNDCRRCKILTDSFEHWLQQTSRGKYEGGDSAWEEAKLKAYSRSEVRLVEVQEGLCSEVRRDQDQCYSLAEEAEQVLEKWWFQKNPNTFDLFKWICIDNLKYCCPKNHFGDKCSPCPIDSNNKVCGDKGKCDGDGTRAGNGTCICKIGYIGKYCEDCDKNFYRTNSENCEQCNLACDGCSGDGASACITCKVGWHLESNVCIDVNECSDPGICKLGQFCENLEGTYVCRKCDKSCKGCFGIGFSNCSSCEPKDILWSGKCISQELKNELFTSALKRFAIYVCLFVMLFLVVHRSKNLASLGVLIVSVLIYISENKLAINFFDVIFIYQIHDEQSSKI